LLNYLQFKKNVENLLLIKKRNSYLLALSGGADSMVMAHLMLEMGFTIQVAHINYKLRNSDSDQDQKVVENFCTKNKIPFHLYTVSDKDQKPKGSVQTWAREVRYSFFNEILTEENLDCIATAHHLNDDLETFFINLSRGSGLLGLSGIPKNEGLVFRPLLPFTKDEIYYFAQQNSIEYREDLSNKKNDYLRNKFRNTLIPELIKIAPDFQENFGKSLQYLADTQNFVEEMVDKIFLNLSKKNNQIWEIDLGQLSAESRFVQFQILKRFGFNQPQEIEKILTATTGSAFSNRQYQLVVNRNQLLISEFNDEKEITSPETLVLVETLEDLKKNNFTLYLKDFEADLVELNSEKNFSKTWCFDYSVLHFPLQLRRKKEGDVFQPIGMIGKKKISKFFKDEKIPIFAQQNIWLLCDGNDDILGILPFRQDRRFVANKKSEKIINVKLLRSE
jgi:tRNA(Ile)-lysidine synthase